MTEYYTECLVLRREPKGEFDENITLYTRDFGKIVVSAKSVRRIESKLSGHLRVGGLSAIRVIKKNNLQLVDALSEQNPITPETIRFIRFIENMTAYGVPDSHLWHGVWYVAKSGLGANSGELPSARVYRRFLEIFGFGAKFARCHECDNPKISYFHLPMLVFLCSDSFTKLSIDETEAVKV